MNLVEFGCIGAEKSDGRFSSVVWWFLRKIRPTQLWVELSWVVAKTMSATTGGAHKPLGAKVCVTGQLRLCFARKLPCDLDATN